VEAQEIHRPALDAYLRRNMKAQYVLKAAGANRGSLYFDATDPFAGQASATPFAGNIKVPVTTIDAEIAERNLPGPYLLKFDVHGFELPILEGAKQTLKDCSLIVMECYNFEIAPTALLFHDMCRHLHELGFRVVDISEPLWRLSDHALWQMDIFFVPAARPEFQSNSYR
jgi:FkbM family methyltransferase